MKYILALITSLIFTSCATTITGTKETVFFDSDPTGSILELNGKNVGKTPCSLDLKKNNNYTFVVRKEGFTPQELVITKGFQPIFLGNLAFGGPLGMLIDVLSGAVYELSPQRNFTVLNPTNASEHSVKTDTISTENK